MSGEAHRAGVFKKPAKPHKPWKGKRTKGQIDNDNRGRLGVRELLRDASRARGLSKEDRRLRVANIRKSKLKAAIERKRASTSSAPILVTVLSFGAAPTAAELTNRLAACDETIQRNDAHGVSYFSVPRFKARLGFLAPRRDHLDEVLDALKVADMVCFMWPLNGEITSGDELILTTLKAHGCPNVVNIVPGLSELVGKKKEEARNVIKDVIVKQNFWDDRLLSSSSDADGIQVLRALIESKKRKLILQKRRSHLLVEKLDAGAEEGGVCTLLASGYVRGPSWNVHRLVHLQGWGDFQVSKIVLEHDPYPLKASKPNDAPPKVIVADPAKADSLQSEIVPDPMDGEQTWPDEHDVVSKEKLMKSGEMKKVPKGTSSYQAAWILEENEEDDEDDEEAGSSGDDDDEDIDDDSDEDAMDGEVEAPAEEPEEEEEEVNMDDAETVASEYMDDEDIDMSEVEKYRKERENAQFPDEIDTPIELPARVRFQKYRGLKSFRTSKWDALENLPLNYARIFKFANFKKTNKTVLAGIGGGEPDECAETGQFVTIHIERVPTSFIAELDKDAPLVLYQLLPHEQKMSVVNIVLRKHADCTVPIINKQKLIFHVGFRKFEAEAVFSQHTNGDKFKMERFMPTDAACVATVFAPILFPPASALCFRKDDKGRQELVGFGSVLDNNPDRVVLKRIVLSGHPFKINKRSAVVRYMFFNREDIEWFKPVELYTPRGRRGHIKEPLGTHGHMKCRFDQQLNAQDSVMMSLYKRAFPKWTYNPRIEKLAPSRLLNGTVTAKGNEEMDEE